MSKRTKYLLLFITGLLMLNISCTQNNCKEVLKPDCVCTMIYDPVCGCNSKTYGNSCEAECHGITDYKKGEC